MQYVFYDLETTGTNVAFDQVLQFSALLTDETFTEKDRIDLRCRLLPWIVPSPTALTITHIDVNDLQSSRLATHYQMMTSIRNVLESWGPAIFVGYNSMRFDEPMLNRAFWQTLHPPYLTVSNGNSRLDLLPLVRAAAFLREGSLVVPRDRDGRPTYRLDQIAPINGFTDHDAHDAMGDVLATRFLTGLVAERAPEIWSIFVNRTTKAATSSVLKYGEPVYVYEHSAGSSSMWWGQRLDRGSADGRAVVANLQHDWASVGEELQRNEARDPGHDLLRSISLNKSPILFTEAEAIAVLGVQPSIDVLEQSRLLREAAWAELAVEALSVDWAPPRQGRELEEMIYDSFPSIDDDRRMTKFHAGTWKARADIAREFTDSRYRSLARRVIFCSAPELLSKDERRRIVFGIRDRLLAPANSGHPWRSIAMAKLEIADAIALGQTQSEEYAAMSIWLDQVAAGQGSQSLRV